MMSIFFCSQEDIENFKAEMEKRQLSEENEAEQEKVKQIEN